MFLGDSLEIYGRASSAKVNWGKSQALQVGQWADKVMPKLPGNLSWGKQGMKVLGDFLGTDGFQKKNCVCYGESVCQTV